jgi:hypothetical protein
MGFILEQFQAFELRAGGIDAFPASPIDEIGHVSDLRPAQDQADREPPRDAAGMNIETGGSRLTRK